MKKQKKDLFGILFESGSYRLGILVIMCLVMSVISDNFFKVSNFLNIFRQASVLLILAACATGCILTHGIDNSIGGVMSLCGCTCGWLLNNGVSIPVTIILTILTGMAFGCINGFLVGVAKIPPFVSTYGVSYIANGLALILMGSDIFSGFPREFRKLASGSVLKFPLITIIALGVTLLMYLLFQRSKFGKQVYCVGANYTTAKYSGINTLLTLFIVYIISGGGAAIGGILQVARQSAAQAGMGDSFQMTAIASIVIGGTSMAGGEGSIFGAIIGALVLTLIVNAMNLLGVPALAQSIATGLIIVLAVLLDVQLKKIQEARAAKSA